MAETARLALPRQPLGGDGPLVGRIGLGCARLSGTSSAADVGPENRRRALAAFEAALEAGITLFDLADVYGGGTSEEVFGHCLRAVPGVRERIVVATKCGTGGGRYDLSATHIKESVDCSLRRMGMDYLDLLQLHRPDPLTHPAETARALRDLVGRGLIRHVGVSNYLPEQVRALRRHLAIPLRTAQLEIGLGQLNAIYEGLDGGDGTLDQCMVLGVTPLAWSPLGRGVVVEAAEHGGGSRLQAELTRQAVWHGARPAQIALAWLLAHPAGIVPLVGSMTPQRIHEAAEATRLTLTREDWFSLWAAARGQHAP